MWHDSYTERGVAAVLLNSGFTLALEGLKLVISTVA